MMSLAIIKFCYTCLAWTTIWVLRVKILTHTLWIVELLADTNILLHTLNWTIRSCVLNDDVWYEYLQPKLDSTLFYLVGKIKCWTQESLPQAVRTAVTKLSFNYSCALTWKLSFHYGQENLKRSEWRQQICSSRSLLLPPYNFANQISTELTRQKRMPFINNMFDKFVTTKWVVFWRLRKTEIYRKNDAKQVSVSLTWSISNWRINIKRVELMSDDENTATKLQFKSKEYLKKNSVASTIIEWWTWKLNDSN